MQTCDLCGKPAGGPRPYTAAQLRTAAIRGLGTTLARPPALPGAAAKRQPQTAWLEQANRQDSSVACAACATLLDRALFSGAGAMIAPGDPGVALPAPGMLARLKRLFAG